MSFVNRLTAKLDLSIGQTKISIPGGNIKTMSLALHRWGFRAKASFWLVSQAKESEDKLFTPFVGSSRIDVTLTIDRTFDSVGESAQPIKLTGIVEERSVQERAFEELAGGPVLHRRYTIEFRDPGAVLWSRHRPVTLLQDSTHANLIKQETPAELTVSSKWKKATRQHPVLSLGLGAAGCSATFYDFIHWLGQRDGFALLFDADKKTYTLDEAKTSPKAKAIPSADIETTEIIFDPPPRHTIEVLNGAAEAKTKKKKVANARAFKGIREDLLLVTSVAKDMETKATAVKSNLNVMPARTQIEFARYPSITLRPGLLYNFAELSQRIYPAKKNYRMCSLFIEAVAERQAATDDTDDDSNSYRLQVTADLEDATDGRWTYPPFETPSWPFHVEGKVVSDQGQKTEGTFQAYTDKTTTLDHHYVLIPLWAKKVRTPFHPNYLTGHFYFPPYKDQRVLVALGFEYAYIERYLDWRPGGRLPKESQGNHILFGKKADDQTSVRHTYSNSKPLLTVERTSDVDLQTIVVSEGTIKFETKESKKK